MKGLLFLFVLSPVILFGQIRQKAIIDSIKAAATTLEGVSSFISNNPGTEVKQIKVSDSGKYVTILVRVRVTAPDIIVPLPPQPFAGIKTGKIIVGKMRAVAVPALPPPISVADSIPALLPCAVFKLEIRDIPYAYAGAVTLPPLPEVFTIDYLPPIALSRISIQDVVPPMVTSASVPDLPEVLSYIIDLLSPHSVSAFSIADIVFDKIDTVTLPPLPEVKLETIDPLALVAPYEIAIVYTPINKMDTTAIPVFRELKMPVEGMHLSDEGYILLEKLEGFSPELYSLKDGGLTIGFGFFVPYNEARVWDKGITLEEAERMIREKVPTYEDQVKQYINVPLTQEEFDALTMLAYNLGGFSKATSIVKDINGYADYDKLRSDWMRFVHSKAPGVMKGLMNRRRDEMAVRNASDYQPERKILIYKNRR